LEIRLTAVKIRQGILTGSPNESKEQVLTKESNSDPKYRNQNMKRNLRARAKRGFTIVELIVVITVIGFLAAVAVGAYNRVVNDAKRTKSTALVNTLSTAKSLFVADPATTQDNITTFNGGDVDTQFGLIAQYIRVNGAIPKDKGDLLSLSGFPATGVDITLGKVDDKKSGTLDSAPEVNGYP
jgi:prepilin-type N-terminal cleavage/methylation domain-containing protein